jgi:putative endonuclease
MITSKKKFGNWGENLAQEYLRRHHYTIITANYRTGRREIDLIARHNGQVTFIEVKTRIKTPASLADNPLSARQIKNLQQAIIVYCLKNRLSFETVRLDLIIITADRQNQKVRFKHYRDIF